MAEEQDSANPAPKPAKKPVRSAKQAAPKAVQTEPISKRWADAGPDDELIITPEELAMMAAMWSPDDDRPGKEPKNADGRSFWLRLRRRK